MGRELEEMPSLFAGADTEKCNRDTGKPLIHTSTVLLANNHMYKKNLLYIYNSNHPIVIDNRLRRVE